MTRHFCTLFDKAFLARGLSLFDSLAKHCPDLMVWMLCMDNESYDTLSKLNYRNITPLRLSEVEDAELLGVKSGRSNSEYCWMMSSSLPLFLLEKKGLNMITYLDADMYFLGDVEEIFYEFGDNSIMIIPHWYADKNDPKLKLSGIYNVGMLIFRNDKNGLGCLHWWKNKCVEWCFARYEDGKFGDQLYLNDWPERFEGVYVLKNHGANVASWNIEGYEFFDKEHKLNLRVKNTNEHFPVIFYHYHGLKFFLTYAHKIKPYPVCILNGKMTRQVIIALEESYHKLWKIEPNWNYGFAPKLDILRRIKQNIVLYFSKFN